MKQVDLFVHFINNQHKLVRVNAEMPVSKVVQELGSKLNGDDPADSQGAYKLYIARQVTYLDDTTLDSIELPSGNLAPGDFILVVPIVPSDVQLYLAPQKRFDHPGWTINEQEVLIGRNDADNGIEPDVDLTSFASDPTTISRQLAYLREKEEGWTIQLHQDAHSAVYVDKAKLEPGQVVRLSDHTILSFGGTAVKPDFQLQVLLVAKK